MPTIRKRGRAWYLCWSEGGQECRRSLGQISEAEARAAARLKDRELRQRRLANVVTIPQAHMPTLREYAQQVYLPWHEREYPHSHERVASIFEQHLIPAMGTHALDRLTKAQAERYKAHREAKAETVAKELRTLQAALNRAVFLEIIPRNPIKGVRPPRSHDSRPPRWYAAGELDLLYQHSQALAGDEQAKGRAPNGWPDYAPIWRLMANTGLRRAEALALRWIDVGDDEIRVLSTDTQRTKSGRWRTVPLSPGAVAARDALRPLTGKRPHVLPRMDPVTLSRAFTRHVGRAGLDGNLHCLRHTFCASLVMQGVPLRTVQVLAGHASMATTERYAHLAPGYLRSAVSGLIL